MHGMILRLPKQQVITRSQAVAQARELGLLDG